jgi:hypothetical protein
MFCIQTLNHNYENGGMSFHICDKLRHVPIASVLCSRYNLLHQAKS